MDTNNAEAPRTFLDGENIWSCFTCGAHLTYGGDIMSKNFQGRHGRAYLVNNIVNIVVGEPEQRDLETGLHTIADIRCRICDTLLGWKYIQAPNDNQKYKENNFILEKAKIKKANVET